MKRKSINLDVKNWEKLQNLKTKFRYNSMDELFQAIDNKVNLDKLKLK